MAEAAHKGTIVSIDLADADQVLEYVRSIPALRERMGTTAPLECRLLDSSGLSRTFEVVASGQGIAIVKQASSSICVKGEEWPLEHRHTLFERRALELYDSICPGMVPEVLHSDAVHGILIVEHLGALKSLEQLWMDGAKALPTPDTLARYCAHVMFRTSDYFLSAEQKMTLVEFFAPNMELAALSDRRLFLNSFMDRPFGGGEDAPRLAESISSLRRERMTRQECLCHGRLGGRSIVMQGDALHVLSPSYTCWGPLGFDPGTVCGQQVALALRHGTNGMELCMGWIHAFWERLESEFRSLWRQENHGEGTPADFFERMGGENALDGVRTTVLQGLLRTATGFAGCELMAIAWEQPHDRGADAQHRVGRELVMCHGDVVSIQDVGAIVMEYGHRV